MAVPAGMAASTIGVPIVLLNADAAPLMSTTQCCRPLVSGVLCGFDGEARARRARRDSSPATRCGRRSPPSRPPPSAIAGRTGPLRLLVIGGSLGAQVLNETVPQALSRMPAERRPRVVHQCGARHLESVRAAYANAGVQADVVTFIDDMATRYAEADLVLARAGAITVTELAAAGVPSILVPLVVSTTRSPADQRASSWRRSRPPIHLPQGEAHGPAPGRAARRPRSRAPADDGRSRACPRQAEGNRNGRGGDREGGWHEARRRAHAPRGRDVKHAVKHIHFVGIGGSGMSGIAEVLLTLGYQVSGSDVANNAATKRLTQLGASISLGHAAEHIAGADAVVVSTAVSHSNPEVLAARARRVPGRAARSDAGRADAAEAGHRDRRHARQDDDHQPGGQRARRRRSRPDLRDRRPAELGRRQRAAREPATTSSSRPTSRTLRS